MLANVLTIVVSVLTGLAVPAFGYLKYRAYTNTVRDVVDKLGVDGLEKLGVVAPPPNLAQHVPRRRASRVRRG
jgi:hypothetical protein